MSSEFLKPLLAGSAVAALALGLTACGPSGDKATADHAGQTAPAARTAQPDADMKAVLDAHAALGAKPIESLNVDENRTGPTLADAVKKVMEAQGLPTTPDATVTTQDLTYPTAGTTQTARIYKPAGVRPNAPVVVYFHGGGWVISNIDVYDATPRAMAKALNAIVVSVEYRKGPENKFPAFYDDANAAYRWVLANAASWGGNPADVALAGESAGGNLALNVAIAARDNGWTAPKAILAVYPIADANPTTASKRENTQSLPLRTPTLLWFGNNALRSPADMTDTRYNLVAANLANLPPVTIVNAQIDPLRSDGETLQQALQKAGVPVERRVYDGATHEFFSMAAVVAKAKQAQEWSFGRLKTALS